MYQTTSPNLYNCRSVDRCKLFLSLADMKEEFRAVPSDTSAVVGADVVLECSPPKGNPPPVVKWRKDGDNLDLTSSSRVRGMWRP